LVGRDRFELSTYGLRVQVKSHSGVLITIPN
jgi:hypothetical protein